jgi:MraZ protein
MPMIRQIYTWFTHGGVEAHSEQDGRVFFSTYEGAIDAKGRVSIPAPFRAALGGNSRVFIWIAPDGSGALEGGGEALMELYAETLAELPLQSPVREAVVTSVIAGSADLRIDETGRVKLPDEFCEAAGLSGRIKFTGAVESFKIWDPARFDLHRSRQAGVVQRPDVLDAFHEAYRNVRQRRAASARGEGG